jgi:hypothetical protein
LSRASLINSTLLLFEGSTNSDGVLLINEGEIG